MIEKTADLWAEPADARCITTNRVVTATGTLVMGAGNALQAKQRYPGIETVLGKLVTEGGNVPYYLEQWQIITFPTKHHYRHNSPLGLVLSSAVKVVELVDQHGLKKVVLPRPGCGLGGLQWELVKSKLEKILDDRFIVVNK